MITFEDFSRLALNLQETAVEPHFEKTSFRFNKKIYATYDDKTHRACLKLSEADQDIYAAMSRGAVYPVDNKWGLQGWTWVDLSDVDEDLMADALASAYDNVKGK